MDSLRGDRGAVLHQRALGENLTDEQRRYLDRHLKEAPLGIRNADCRLDVALVVLYGWGMVTQIGKVSKALKEKLGWTWTIDELFEPASYQYLVYGTTQTIEQTAGPVNCLP